MKELEFMAFYAADFLDPEKVAGKISRLINEAEHEEVGDQYARVMLLTQALVNDKMKPEAQAGKPGQPSGLRKLIEDGKINQYAKKQKIMLEKLCYQGDFTNLACLTPFSFAMNFQFTLRKPYLSRDDAELYVIDNPIKKEWVFKVPYISPGQ